MTLPHATLWRMMYLRKDYQAVCSFSNDLQGLVVAPHATLPAVQAAANAAAGHQGKTQKHKKHGKGKTSKQSDAGTASDSDLDEKTLFADTSAETVDIWKGTVFVRDETSPWHSGAFPFTITFPSNYPFECPTVTFDNPLPSHPMLLHNGTVLPFDEEHAMLDPMTCSILLRVLRLVRRVFTLEELEMRGLKVDLNKARRDVTLSSVKIPAATASPIEGRKQEAAGGKRDGAGTPPKQVMRN